MEGVPRLPMLSCELKVSPSNTEFGPTLKKYIREHYHEDGESYSKEIKELETLRLAACKVPRDFTGCSTLKKYYSQLLCLQNRFPMTDEGPACVPFMWSDIYSGMVFNITDIKYEQACILYNIGALHSELGAMDNRHNAEGMKIACTHFQCSVWAFQHLRDNFPQPKGSDMSHDLLTLFIYVMLAQAQECILEKSMLDSRKASITAKVAAQVVDYYKNALNTLNSGSTNLDVGCILDIVGSKLFKTWKKFLEFKEAYYSSISRLYNGMQSEEQQKMGDRVAWFQAALDKLNEAIKIAKNIDRDDLGEALSYTMDVIGGKLNAAKKENDFVYHEKVPSVESLHDVQGASLVKGIPFNPTDPDVCGPDIFARLVPMEAHEAASVYSEEKAKILRNISARIEEKNQELVAYLSSLQLDRSMLSPQVEKIPEELIEKCAALSVQPNAIIDSEKVVQALYKVCEEVDGALKEAMQSLNSEEEREKRHQEIFGKRAPSMVVVDLKKECSKYEEAHNKAKESNLNLHKALAVHIENLKLLMGPLEALKQILPSVSQIEINPEITQDLNRLLDKVDEMKQQRLMLESQFREAIQNDDITKKLVTKGQKEDLQAFFADELRKHDQLKSLLEQNLLAQDNILRALTQANARYADIRRALMETTARREEKIAALISSYEAYEDLMLKAQKGLDFYNKLQTSVLRVLARVRSVTSVREEEREQLSNARALKVGRKMPPASTPSVSVAPSPKLKDYLPYMSSRGSGVSMPPVSVPTTYTYQPADAVPASAPPIAPVPQAASTYPPAIVSTAPYRPDMTPHDFSQVPQPSTQPSPPVQTVTNAVSEPIPIPPSSYSTGYPGQYSGTGTVLPVPDASANTYSVGNQNQWPLQDKKPEIGVAPSAYASTSPPLSNQQPMPYMAPNSFTGTTYTANRYTNPQTPLSYNTSASPSTNNYSQYGLPAMAGMSPMPHATSVLSQSATVTHNTPGRPLNANATAGTDGRAVYNSFSANLYQSVNTMSHFPSPHQNTMSYSTCNDTSNYLQLAGQNNKIGSDYKAYYEQSNSYMNYQSQAQGFTTQSYTSTHPYSVQTYSITSTKPQSSPRQEAPVPPISLSQTPAYSQSQGVYGGQYYQPTAADPSGSVYGQSNQYAAQLQASASQASQYYQQYSNSVVQQGTEASSNASYVNQQANYQQYQQQGVPYVQGQWTPVSYVTPVQEQQATIATPPVAVSSNEVASPHSAPNTGPVLQAAAITTVPNIATPLPSSQPVSVPSAAHLQHTNTKNEDLLSTTPERVSSTVEPQTTVLQPKVLSSLDLQLQKDAIEMEKKRLHQKADPFSNQANLDKFIVEVEKFEKYVDSLCKKSLNGPTQLDQKWKELMDTQDRDSRKLSISVARCYPMKNRFPDIMPYDSNRVELSSVRNDYINGSHIKDITPNSPRYIVTQAPLPATYPDFWAMVWEQQAEIIVCLLNNAELKTHIYWPLERGQQLSYGPVSISLQSVKEKQCYIESMINISHNETRISRVVIHMQFTAWPGSSGNPSSPALLLQFISEVHNYYRQQRNLLRPLIVHCSGGIGRSGLFCLILSAIVEMMAGQGLLDIVQTAALMCQQRRFLLQEKEHLKFCYEAVLYHAQDILMKRGILTNKATFDDKLPSGNPLHSHKRHPSEDFILGGLNKIQTGVEELAVSGGDNMQQPNAGNVTDDEKSEQTTNVPAVESQDATVTSDGNTANIAENTDVGNEPADQAKDNSDASTGGAKSQYITSLLDPASFTLDPIASPGKRKITKESFQNPAASLMHHSTDPNDPLSQLDPLWTIHKGKQ